MPEIKTVENDESEEQYSEWLLNLPVLFFLERLQRVLAVR